MSKKFAVFDIDGTLFRSGLYREVAYEMMKSGVLPKEILDETTIKNREWRHRTHGNAFEEFEMLMIDRIDNSCHTFASMITKKPPKSFSRKKPKMSMSTLGI